MPSASPTAAHQLYQCPSDIQDRLTSIGGVNRYGEPNFLLRWAMGGEDGCYYRAGGTWEIEGLPSFTGYRDLLVGGGTPSWMLLIWQAPELYGTPELYYLQNKDESGMQTLGEFPYKGRYQLLYNLRWTERRGNAIHFEAMPLNSLLLNTIVPIIMAARDISWEKTKAALQDITLRENAKDVDTIEDLIRDRAVPFKGSPVSYGKQGCRTSLVDKKIASMQRNWNTMMTNAKAIGKGLSQRSA